MGLFHGGPDDVNWVTLLLTSTVTYASIIRFEMNRGKIELHSEHRDYGNFSKPLEDLSNFVFTEILSCSVTLSGLLVSNTLILAFQQ